MTTRSDLEKSDDQALLLIGRHVKLVKFERAEEGTSYGWSKHSSIPNYLRYESLL